NRINLSTTAKTIPIAHKVVTTRHSHQRRNSKWRCNGHMLQTITAVVSYGINCIITDYVTITSTPPRIAKIISILVKIAMAAIVAPKLNEPVSPINTLAGCALNTKKPNNAPTTVKANIVTNSNSG